MKCTYKVVESTKYDEAIKDKDLKSYIKDNPLMLLYKFVLLKEVK